MLGNKVTVFGATGYIGREVVNELANTGYEVRVVVRRPERFREFALYPNTKLFTLESFDDTEALKQSMQDSEVVFNLIADRSTGTEMIDLDDMGNVGKRLKSAMESAHVKRVLSLSFIGANNDCDSHEWLGVLADFDNQMHAVSTANETIFRAGMLIGENDQSTAYYVKQLLRFPFLAVANGGSEVQPLWVKDFAKAMVSSIRNEQLFGQKIEVAGTESMTVKELGEKVAAIMEQDDAVVFPMCKLNARFMAALGILAPIQSIHKSQLTLLANDATTETEFAEVFEMTPSSLDWVIAQYAKPKHQREKYNDYRKNAGRDEN
ncbi:NAD(P)H-binding protein [Thiomicrorhabdus indica]|uniref:NAD(P)H-binding protein n=1 Tax=Thiomicrorhabdus indica TaxID=2267253 RepID=UPI002AA8B906|nr:NAD(P)H-binding protein [Thiomicrorhabdus indica]